MKFTTEALDDFQLCLAEQAQRFNMVWGRDEMLLGALATGTRSAVGSTYNIAAPLYSQLMAAFEGGDLDRARTLQRQSSRLIQAMVGTGNFFAALKYLLARQGLPIAPRLRQPLPPVEDSWRPALDETLCEPLVP